MTESSCEVPPYARKIQRFVFCLALCAFVFGCQKFASGSLGEFSASNDKSSRMITYVTQNVDQREYLRSGKKNPIFAVLGAGIRITSTESDGRNRLVSINSHNIEFDFSKQAIYLLRPDYSLEVVPLNPSDVQRLLMLLSDNSVMGNDLDKLRNDPSWRINVAPLILKAQSHLGG